MTKMLMQSVLFLGALSIFGGGAGAMPVANASHRIYVTKTDWQCGQHWHVTPSGTCRPNRPARYYGYYSWRYLPDGSTGYGWYPGYGWRHSDGWSDYDYRQYDDDDPDDNSED
ncbi:MAG: hypothetical protein JSR61_14510 [Proteobacteria bacterium]|nr:hypothetical protein [Pseudomonadota bacterium]